MTPKRKLLYNGLVTATGIFLIGIVALIGIYHVRQGIFDVTEKSTPRQLKTLAFIKTLQEHGTLLSLTTSVSSESDVSEKERELSRTLGELKKTMPELKSFEPLRSTTMIESTVHEVETLTGKITNSTRERVRAEQRADKSRAEAQELIRLNAKHRSALQLSLKDLQTSTVSGLMTSSSKTKGMTDQFRELQAAKDFFQQLQSAVDDLRTATNLENIPVIKGRAAFAIKELKRSLQVDPEVTELLVAFEKTAFDAEGPFSLALAHLKNPTALKTTLFSKNHGISALSGSTKYRAL